MFKEPHIIRLTRTIIITSLFLLLVGFITFNTIRYVNAPIIYRTLTTDEPIQFPSLLINLNDFERGDTFTVACSRTHRNISAVGGSTSVPATLLPNAEYPRDFTLQHFVDPPFQQGVSFLLDASHNSKQDAWQSMTGDRLDYDLHVNCSISVTSLTPVTHLLLGEVLVEPSTGSKPNVFSAVENTFLLIHGQYYNAVIEVTKRCLLNSTCSYEREISFSQASQLPGIPTTNTTTGTNVVTFQIANKPGAIPGYFKMQVTEQVRSYGLLEVLSSVLSAFSILLLIYTQLMGDRRLDPLGYVRRFLLRSATERYVDGILGHPHGDLAALKSVLFGLYLQGDLGFGLGDRPSGWLRGFVEKPKHTTSDPMWQQLT